MIRLIFLAPLAFVLIGVPTATGQAVKNEIPEAAEMILRKGDQFELLALNPSEKGDFYGWKVEKRTMIKDPAVRTKIVDEIKRAVAESNQIAPKEIIKPRYGLRVTRDGKIAELAISFDQKKGVVFVDGKQVAPIRLTDSPVKLLDSLIAK